MRGWPAAVVLAAMAAGCGGASDAGRVDGACRPGETVACTCDDGSAGTAVCGEACTCEPAADGVIAEPAVLDFGTVHPGDRREGAVWLTNLGPTPVAIRSAAFEDPVDPALRVAADLPAAIPARGDVAIPVAFAPTAPGIVAGRLVVELDHPDSGRVEVAVTGVAAGPVLSCSPAVVEFGSVFQNERGTKNLVCTNTGVEGGDGASARLHLDRLELEGAAAFSAQVREQEESWGVGESFVVDVDFAPVAGGEAGATLAIVTDGGTVRIELRGAGAELPPCRVRPVPAQLRFSIVDEGETRTFEIAILNERTDSGCWLRNLRITPADDPPATLSVQGDHWLPAGDEVRVSVTVHQSRDFQVRFEVNDPEHPEHVVPVRFDLLPTEPCALATPETLELGSVSAGCAARTRKVQLLNVCAAPLQVTSLELAGPDVFGITGSTVPTTVEAGAAVEFDVEYRPAEAGDHEGLLVFGLVAGQTVSVRLEGHALPPEEQIDVHVQGDPPQACFSLTVLPRDADESGAIEPGEVTVVVDGAPTPAVAEGVTRWWYDAGGNRICFLPEAVPPAGASVELGYVAACP